VLCGWLACGGARAAGCDASVEPISGPDGYQERGGQRCEGLYVSRVSGPAMELVSLTWGLFPGNRTDAGDLSVSVPRPPGRTGSVHVRALGLPAGLYYRLDVDMPPGGHVTWPTAPVLSRQHIGFDQVGLFAFARSASGQPVYLPVAVDDTVDPKAGVVAEIRPLTPVDDLLWRFVRPGLPAPSWQPAQFRDECFTITLPDAADDGAGSLQLRWSDADSGTAEIKRFDIEY